ncbi:unnamed protein product [Cylicocyclus nassatus]|uniref:Uncharacterized protein n=1 Tax=Cylicocyclus nassatus TaxID=53992 RepID=A0AA36GM54_CYLNA|nr:unnamed protein product [Cylicocyclus nassatus]
MIETKCFQELNVFFEEDGSLVPIVLDFLCLQSSFREDVQITIRPTSASKGGKGPPKEARSWHQWFFHQKRWWSFRYGNEFVKPTNYVFLFQVFEK